MEQVLKTMLENVRAKTPLVHNITNYVTVNDVANVLLAAGGSPIMSDDADDVEDITSICGGLNINIGTLNKNTIPSMFLAGRKANELGHIVLLDPVGAGASRLRTDTANRLMREVRFDAVRGNISEIKTLCTGSGTTKGVDADAVDAVTEANLDDGVALVYILEALSVMIQVTYFKYTKKKYGEGRRIFKMTPIHHHFEMSGFSEYKIVITFSLFGLIAGAVGLLLVTL